MPVSRVIATLVAAALLVAACAGPGSSVIGTIGPTDPPGSAACTTLPAPPEGLEGWTPPATAPPVIPFIINAAGELVCGSNRLLFTIIDPKTNAPIGAPDRFAKV